MVSFLFGLLFSFVFFTIVGKVCNAIEDIEERIKSKKHERR